uniref:hypothetical protein n=1 Tax=Trichocoleus desertorum TaxID=1481672 RepID=UPI0025B2FF84|nr:hypothetical protein [Trichocoleus desertorum]
MPAVMVFDVESVGLHGEGYAVGFVVLDECGWEIDSGYFACDSDLAVGAGSDRKWIQENVEPHLPGLNCNSSKDVRQAFWEKWMSWRTQNATLWADCGWPVEANFLSACVRDDWRDRCWTGPYPLMEIATVLQVAGLNPLEKYPRLEDELPVHHPTCDARQSGRLLFEAMHKIRGGNE